MNGSREAIIAAVLACGTQAVAFEPPTSTDFGVMLKSGWGLSGEFVESVSGRDLVSPSPYANSAPPVMQGPVEPLRAMNAAANRDTTAAGNTEGDSTKGKFGFDTKFKLEESGVRQLAADPELRVDAEFQKADRDNDQLDFESLQVDRAPSVPRLRPRRSFGENVRENFDEDSKAKVIVAEPISGFGLPFRTFADFSQVGGQGENVGPADVCDLVDVDAAESRSAVVAGWKSLPKALEGPARKAGLGDAERFPELEAVASVFKALQVTEADDGDPENVEMLQLPTHAMTQAYEIDWLDFWPQQPLPADSFESKASMTDSWGLIESTRYAPVDPLASVAELWQLTQRSLRQARQSRESGSVVE